MVFRNGLEAACRDSWYCLWMVSSCVAAWSHIASAITYQSLRRSENNNSRHYICICNLGYPHKISDQDALVEFKFMVMNSVVSQDYGLSRSFCKNMVAVEGLTKYSVLCLIPCDAIQYIDPLKILMSFKMGRLILLKLHSLRSAQDKKYLVSRC